MANYQIDASHSEVTFKIKHLMISNVTGKFDKFDGSMTTDGDDLTKAQINFEADIDSINTNSEQRDTHLKSDDFFAADKFPKLSFSSTSFKKVSESDYVLTGDFTIRDITKTISLDVDYNGEMVDPWGQTKRGFEIKRKDQPQDFDLKWSAVTEAGGVVVSDEVKLHLNIQLVKQA